MTIGILCAIPQELGHLQDNLIDERDQVEAGLRFIGGKLDGMTAFMTGKLKIEGDMSVAMKLQSILR